MKHLRILRFPAETSLLYVAATVFPWLPRQAIVGMANFFGDVACSLNVGVRRIALANLECAFGSEIDQNGKESIVRGSFRNFALVVLDMFWFSKFTARRLARWVRRDAAFAHYTETAPAIAVTAHLGNWEVMGQMAALCGAPPMSVAAPIENHAVDRWLLRQRARTGQMVVPARGAMRALLSHLRKGGRVAFLLDQNTLPRDGGVFVSFFKRKALMSRAAAALSRRTGAPIVMTFTIPEVGGSYKAWADEPWIVDNGDHAELDACERIAAEIEKVVRLYPNQWLWAYKRWKYLPDGEDRSAYPFYAREMNCEEKGG